MGPNTRARLAQSLLYIKDDSCGEQITNTLDPIQKTFKTQERYLAAWRFVLYQRYAGEHQPKSLIVRWTNYGLLHRPLPSTPIISHNEKIPSDLRQSTIDLRLRIGHKEIMKTVLKIHVYYSTCTVLLQGKACRKWVDEEFQTLVKIVHTLADTNMDVLSLTAPALKTPTVTEYKAIAIEVTHPSQDDLSLLKYIAPAQRPKAPKGTPSHSPTLQALLDRPQFPLPYPPPATDDPSFPPSTSTANNNATQPTINSHISHLHPTANQTNHDVELSCHLNCVQRELFETITTSLREEIAVLRASLLQLTEQIQSRDAVCHTPARRPASTDSGMTGNSHDSPAIRPRNPQSSDTSETSPPLPHASPQPRARPLPSPRNTIPPPPYPSSPRLKQDTRPTPVPRTTTNRRLRPVTHQVTVSSPPPPSSKVEVAEANRHKQNHRLGVHPNTATLILGDSVVAGLHQDKMAVDKEPCQVLSLSGLNNSKLLAALRDTPTLTQITTLVIHVGINVCKTGYIVSQEAWHSVISNCQRCFPRARIMMSSILPHKDCHPHITSCIVQSNKNMQAASEQAGSHYVNNDLTFYTLSGQLKTGWLRDSIHPNTRGSSGLAVNIKRHFSATLAGRNMTPPPTDQTLCAGKTQIPLLTNRSFHPPSRPSRRNQTPYNPSPPQQATPFLPPKTHTIALQNEDRTDNPRSSRH